MVLHWAGAEWSQVGREAASANGASQPRGYLALQLSSLVTSRDTLVQAQHTRIATMKFSSAIVLPLLSLGSGLAAAAASWSFEDATLSISSKGAGVGGALKEK